MSGSALRERVSRLVAPLSDDDAVAGTSLDAVIRLLQGQAGATQAIADSGIARLDSADLQALASNALCESEACLERLRLLLGLLEGGPAAPALQQGNTGLILRQAMRSLADYRRWCDLADNAAYYRDHREVSRKIAAA